MVGIDRGCGNGRQIAGTPAKRSAYGLHAIDSRDASSSKWYCRRYCMSHAQQQAIGCPPVRPFRLRTMSVRRTRFPPPTCREFGPPCGWSYCGVAPADMGGQAVAMPTGEDRSALQVCDAATERGLDCRSRRLRVRRAGPVGLTWSQRSCWRRCSGFLRRGDCLGVILITPGGRFPGGRPRTGDLRHRRGDLRFSGNIGGPRRFRCQR